MSEHKYNPHLYAIIVGEMSGDTLGVGLMKAILRQDPLAKFVGIGGPKMIAAGFHSAFEMDSLAVMGITEVVAHLFPILRIRSKITKLLLNLRPCIMIGIDAPDFNLTVERKLKQAGIKTIHYVSPSVWAWREGRMKTIRKSCDEVLALLPFEKEYYDQVGMPCTYVGHSLANVIPVEINQKKARERISLNKNCVDGLGHKVLAILPGSRRSVISRMLPLYAKVAREIKAQMKDLTLVTVAPNHDLALLIKDIWLQYTPDVSLTVFVGNGQDVIASADVCLLTSGTIAFETMLLKVPMVVAYKVSWLTAFIARRMVKIDLFSLPNLLAKKELVKELIQENCTTDNLVYETMRLLSSDNLLMKKEFENIHKEILTNSDEIAAEVVFRLINSIPVENLDLDKDSSDLEASIERAFEHNHLNAQKYEEANDSDLSDTTNTQANADVSTDTTTSSQEQKTATDSSSSVDKEVALQEQDDSSTSVNVSASLTKGKQARSKHKSKQKRKSKQNKEQVVITDLEQGNTPIVDLKLKQAQGYRDFVDRTAKVDVSYAENDLGQLEHENNKSAESQKQAKQANQFTIEPRIREALDVYALAQDSEASAKELNNVQQINQEQLLKHDTSKSMSGDNDVLQEAIEPSFHNKKSKRAR